MLKSSKTMVFKDRSQK